MKNWIVAIVAIVCLTVAGCCSDCCGAETDTDVPELLKKDPNPGVDDIFGAGSPRDPHWEYKVEQAFMWLKERSDDHERRITKIEQAQIRVRTASNRTVNRKVPVRSGAGYFNLAPGERLVGYEDVASGRWVDCSGSAPTTIRRSSAPPISVYSSPHTEVRTLPATRSRPVRGMIRVRAGNCAGGSCF